MAGSNTIRSWQSVVPPAETFIPQTTKHPDDELSIEVMDSSPILPPTTSADSAVW
jgi:hypothetical protein